MNTGLAKYDATRQALIECATIDEAKEIKDKAQALVAYAKLSKDNELEKRSVEIRERAKIKLGEISLALPKAKPGPTADTSHIGEVIIPKSEALAEAGVSTSEANRAEKLAKKSEESQEDHIAKAVEAVEKRNTVTAAANTSSESNEWYTPAVYVDAARELFGGVIDLDPASCEKANEGIKADQIFTIEDDALSKSWHGNVFMNPPYGKQAGKSVAGLFCDTAIFEYEAGRVESCVILVNSSHSQKWQAPLYDYPICFVDHRIKFINGFGEDNENPTFQNIFVYLGKDKARFSEVFSPFGYCMERI